MNGRYVLDTNIIISHFQGVKPLTEVISGLLEAYVLASVITKIELLAWDGLTPAAEDEVRSFLGK